MLKFPREEIHALRATAARYRQIADNVLDRRAVGEAENCANELEMRAASIEAWNQLKTH